MRPKPQKTRADLLSRIRYRASRINVADSRALLKVAERLEACDWSGALTSARSMDTLVREYIPAWGWDMLRNMNEALAYIQRVG